MNTVHHWAFQCKDGKAGKSKEEEQRVRQPLTVITEFCRDGVDELIKIKKILRSVRKKLPSKLAFHKNMCVTLLIFLDVRRFLHNGFLMCSRQG